MAADANVILSRALNDDAVAQPQGARRELAREIFVVGRDDQRALLPLQTLESYTLYLAGSKLLHRLGRNDFARSREMLIQVQDRVPRAAAPLAMLAKWHVLRMMQGWTADRAAEGEAARPEDS